jgi:1-acyl-sn-glycerol-3-phosphate acyltransferase
VKGPEAEQRLRERIIDRTSEVLGEPPDQVVLAPPHTVLKTSSGKIRRAACRELYAGGRVSARRYPVWWQLAGLLGGSVLPWCRKLLAVGAHLIYGLYVWLLCGLLGPPTWLLTAIAPGPSFAWRVNRWAARQLLRLAGVELTVLGSEKLPAGPCVLVANHASYVDGLILFAAMPRPFRFVVKREFLNQPLARAYLRGLGAWFVERFDADRSVREPERMAAALRMGDSPAFFPEGTFGRATGLAPFRLGAFVAAVSARAPVLPVALRGTRTLLRDGQWLPRRGPVLVTVGPPVGPASETEDPFAAAVSLRDSARARILAGCGEPDAA